MSCNVRLNDEMLASEKSTKWIEFSRSTASRANECFWPRCAERELWVCIDHNLESLSTDAANHEPDAVIQGRLEFFDAFLVEMVIHREGVIEQWEDKGLHEAFSNMPG